MMTTLRIRGFTLVELVMVIMITGIIAASLTVFLKPAIDSYFDTRRRADLTDMADTALRRMAQDIRRAVPNSIRSVSGTCFQLVPTIGGGRYRMGPNTTANSTPPPQYLDAAGCSSSATCSAPLDATQATTVFDVLSPMTSTPAQNDWIVIGNQNADDVYTDGVTRGQISATPKAPPDIRNTDGRLRLEIETGSGGKQFPSGYDGGRFVVVSNAARSVFYSCNPATRTLYRTVTDFNAVQGTSCGLTTGAGVAVVATDVEGCTFVYAPNQGATQQSGFVWMRLELTRSGESITLAHGAHVDNVP